ncbi:FAD-dependent oxidoreductase [Nocardia sp. NPDC051321]|uniref:FAD-dependent oxidoreductase n=1 Tax=Nocardia sp. NPDC051321 TaxID=3364323 RepID=UPI00378DD81C
MSNVRTALVIGGGIAGPVAASALLKAGIDARVFEAYPGSSYNIGSGLALAPNGIAALDIIDAGDAVRAIAKPISKMGLSIGGKDLFMRGLAGLPPLQMVDRGELHQTLHDHAVSAGVPFEYNKRMVDVVETDAGITARFTDGSTATADVLIGADGIRSTVRGLIDPNAPGPEYLGMLGFGAIIDYDGEIEPESMTFAFGKNAYYLFGSTGDGQVIWGANLPHKEYLSLTAARAIPKAHWLGILRETYADDTPGGEFARRTTEEQLEVSGALHIMPSVPHWFRGRMALVGDAVHAPSNSSGQGASLAIESAVQVARCLRDLPTPEAAFATYEQLRRPRVEAVAARAAKVNHNKTLGPVGRKMMQLTAPLFIKLMNPEKSMGPEQRYRIDWAAPAHQELAVTA